MPPIKLLLKANFLHLPTPLHNGLVYVAENASFSSFNLGHRDTVVPMVAVVERFGSGCNFYYYNFNTGC